jgi:hypothetical protein
VRSVLEGSSELSSIKSQLEFSGISVGNVEGRVLGVDGGVSVVVEVDEASIGSGHGGISILNGRDVISKSNNANASIVGDTVGKVLKLGHGHVVSVSESINSVSEVVLSRPGDDGAIGSGDSPSSLVDPVESSGSAFGRVVLSGLDTDIINSGVVAISLGLDVLRLRLVEIAELLFGGEDSDILPLRRMPIRIVISLLIAFITASSSVVVLSSEDGSRSSSSQTSLLGSISNVKTHVSVSSSAVGVRLKRLVHSKDKVSVGINLSGLSLVRLGSVGGGSVSDLNESIIVGRSAHVLNDDVANKLGVRSASVLIGPLDGKKRSLVVSHRGSNAISTLGVVLRVKKSVSIVSISIGLVKSIVGSSGIVHVDIASGVRNEEEENGKGKLDHL